MAEEITFFAKANFRNKQTPFGIRTDDRRRHTYVIGKTGMGKTTLLENMCIQDIQNGKGLCFIDPHGDSLQKILNCIPSSRMNDVVYFNPADLEYPIAFNILESVDTKYKHLVASGLMGVFTKIWANMWSARMEYILNNTILALLDSPGNTMLGITRMYVDKKYRKRIVDNIKDPIVRAFWTEEYANYTDKYRTEAIAPIQNKVGQFLSSAIIRNIVGQPKSTIDLRSIMDDKKILLMDLSKGKVGEDNSALLGAMVITKLQLAALSRVDIKEEDRQDFYLYVDEFQNFATESFATILSEARKYRLNLTIGHQYIGQLTPDKSNTKIRDAVFGNVGTMICFRVGAADAEFLETEFEPYFVPNDLVNLPKAHIILKLMINGVTSEAFSAVTLPPIDKEYSTGNGDKVIKVSRERYANHYLSVEEKIMRWMGADMVEHAPQISGETEEVEDENHTPVAVIGYDPALLTTEGEDEENEARDEGEQILEAQAPKTESSELRPAPKSKPEPTNVAFSHGFLASGDRQLSKRYLENSEKFGNKSSFKNRGPRRPDNRDNRGNRDSRNNRDTRPPQKKPKKENPIWDIATSSNSSQSSDTVLKPGESLKF